MKKCTKVYIVTDNETGKKYTALTLNEGLNIMFALNDSQWEIEYIYKQAN